MLLRRLVALLLAALAALAPLAASPPVEADEPSQIVRSLEDSLGSPSHIVRSLEDSLGSPSLAWPDRRFAPCGAIDPDAGVLYAFGGRADDGTTHHGDLWALDLAADETPRPVWQQAAAAGSPAAPPPVRSCAAAWEPGSDRLFVFGGWNGATHDGALRAFDPQTGAWQVLCDATSCGAGPSARRAAQLVVDPLGQRVVLVGGTNGTYFDDLWSLDLTNLTWQRVTTPGPIARGGHSMALDPDGDAVWLFGGTRPGPDLGDLWRLDLATMSWTEVAPTCGTGCPSPRSGATLVADPAGDRLVLYGGWESAPNVYHRDAWILDDLDATPAWTLVEPASERPQARFFHVAGYDPATRAMIVFGGGANGSAYKDAVALTLPIGHRPAAWHSIAPTTPLTSRDQVAVVLDGGVLTAFGGFGSGTLPGSITAGTHLADTWQRAIDRRGGWRPATPARRVPIAREGAAYALDDDQHRLLMAGGLTGDTTLADVWMADVSRPGRPRWQQLCSPTSCGAGPSPRWGAHAVYDEPGQRLVVFGGLAAGGVATSDVWALDLTGTPTWQELVPDGPGPAARWSAAYGYDPVGRRLVVFGGQPGTDATGTPLGDSWALSLDGPPHWTPLATSGPAPAARRSPAGAVRVHDGRAELVVAMGYTASTGQHHGDVWSLDLGADDAAWVQLDSGGGAGDPWARRSAAGVFDPVADRFLLAFGRDAAAFTDELWSFDLTTHTWSQLPG